MVGLGDDLHPVVCAQASIWAGPRTIENGSANTRCWYVRFETERWIWQTFTRRFLLQLPENGSVTAPHPNNRSASQCHWLFPGCMLCTTHALDPIVLACTKSCCLLPRRTLPHVVVDSQPPVPIEERKHTSNQPAKLIDCLLNQEKVKLTRIGEADLTASSHVRRGVGVHGSGAQQAAPTRTLLPADAAPPRWQYGAPETGDDAAPRGRLRQPRKKTKVRRAQQRPEVQGNGAEVWMMPEPSPDSQVGQDPRQSMPNDQHMVRTFQALNPFSALPSLSSRQHPVSGTTQQFWSPDDAAAAQQEQPPLWQSGGKPLRIVHLQNPFDDAASRMFGGNRKRALPLASDQFLQLKRGAPVYLVNYDLGHVFQLPSAPKIPAIRSPPKTHRRLRGTDDAQCGSCLTARVNFSYWRMNNPGVPMFDCARCGRKSTFMEGTHGDRKAEAAAIQADATKRANRAAARAARAARAAKAVPPPVQHSTCRAASLGIAHTCHTRHRANPQDAPGVSCRGCGSAAAPFAVLLLPSRRYCFYCPVISANDIILTCHPRPRSVYGSVFIAPAAPDDDESDTGDGGDGQDSKKKRKSKTCNEKDDAKERNRLSRWDAMRTHVFGGVKYPVGELSSMDEKEMTTTAWYRIWKEASNKGRRRASLWEEHHASPGLNLLGQPVDTVADSEQGQNQDPVIPEHETEPKPANPEYVAGAGKRRRPESADSLLSDASHDSDLAEYAAADPSEYDPDRPTQLSPYERSKYDIADFMHSWGTGKRVAVTVKAVAAASKFKRNAGIAGKDRRKQSIADAGFDASSAMVEIESNQLDRLVAPAVERTPAPVPIRPATPKDCFRLKPTSAKLRRPNAKSPNNTMVAVSTLATANKFKHLTDRSNVKKAAEPDVPPS